MPQFFMKKSFKEYYQKINKKYLFNFKENIYKTSHRFLLEYHLKSFFIKKSQSFKNKKIRIVDFGSGNPRYENFKRDAEWYFFDKYPKNKKVKYSEIDNIPIKNAEIFISIEVIQYLSMEKMSKLFKECERIIDKKGIGIFSVPYLYPRNHKELIRLANPESYKKLFSENLNVQVICFGNFISMIHDLLIEFIYKLDSKIIKKFFLLIIYPLKPISLIIQKLNFLKIDSGFIIFIEKH